MQDMINKYNAINRKVDKNYEEQKWKKSQAFDQIINYIVEKENSEPGSVFFVQDLNTMYVENLFQNGTDEQMQTTRFAEILLSGLPDFCSNIVNHKNVVLFNDKISELVTEYTGNSR